jgi:D-alanyl-D-alanine carboxypeptidase
MPVRFLRICKVLIIAVLLPGYSGCSNSDPVPAERLQASVDANWTQYKQAHALPGGGMAVYVESPSGNYFASSGMSAGIDQNTRFRIGSNTKTFTAAAIMLLNQQGKLNIDDTIVSTIPGQAVPYIPASAQYNIPYKASITIRQLLSHTAGVFDISNQEVPSTCPAPYAGQDYISYVRATDPNHQFSADELVGVIATCQISHFSPDGGYKYSNAGYWLLSVIIERVSRMPYDQFLINNLLAPNGLSSTTVPMLGTDQTIPAPFNPGCIYDGSVMTDVTQANFSHSVGSGNILSTPADIARWVKRLIRGEAGPNAVSVQAMKTATPQSGTNNYGLGIFYTAGLGYGHNGAVSGYLSQMLYDPDSDVTTIVYFNVWDVPHLAPDQFTLNVKAARDAKAAVGY